MYVLICGAVILLFVLVGFLIEAAEKRMQKQFDQAKLMIEQRHRAVSSNLESVESTLRKEFVKASREMDIGLRKIMDGFYELAQKNHLDQKMAIEKLGKEYEFLKVHMYSIDKKTQTPPLIRVQVVPAPPKTAAKKRSNGVLNA